MSLHPIPEDEVLLMTDLEDPIRIRFPRSSRSSRSKSRISNCDVRAWLDIKSFSIFSQKLFWAIVKIIGLITISTLTWETLTNYLSIHKENPFHRPSLFTNYLTHGINPIPCHSHNDYWRNVPLYSALAAGCTSVEADIWLENDLLRVGHTKKTILRGQTLHSLYLNPLLEMLQQHNPHQNVSHQPRPQSQSHPHPQPSAHPQSTNQEDPDLIGIFPTSPKTPLTLLIDFKSGEHLWDYLIHTLQPLRESGYLTHTNKNKIIQRPITIVVTGSAPFHRVLSNPYHDIFYDAPLHDLSVSRKDAASSSDANPSPYTPLNSYYASTNFHRSIGSLLLGGLSGDQIAKIRGQIHQAHERGLKVRYWGTPGWPVALRNYVWRILVREGVDVLNVDDLRDASKGDWRGGVRFGVGAWW